MLYQESNVISTSNMTLSRELHIIRAHQLHYSSLLEDFRKTIAFIRATKNPALDSFPKPTRLRSADLMKRECTNLMNEIDRLDMSREMVDKQLKSVMNLVGAYINCPRSNSLCSIVLAVQQRQNKNDRSLRKR